MSRFATTTLFVLCCAALIVGGLYFYYKRQVGYMPEWYAPASVESDETADKEPTSAGKQGDGRAVPRGTTRPTEIPVFRGTSDTPESSGRSVLKYKTPGDPSRTLELQLGEKGRLAIKQEDLMPLLMESMAAEGSNKMADAIQAAKATLHPGSMTMEMIVDVDKIPREELDATGEKTIVWLKEFIQKSGFQQVYLKADLYPVIQGEEMILQPHSSLSVGKFKFELEDLHKNIGIPMHISMDRFIFSDFELQEGRVVIKK